MVKPSVKFIVAIVAFSSRTLVHSPSDAFLEFLKLKHKTSNTILKLSWIQHTSPHNALTKKIQESSPLLWDKKNLPKIPCFILEDMRFWMYLHCICVVQIPSHLHTKVEVNKTLMHNFTYHRKHHNWPWLNNKNTNIGQKKYLEKDFALILT
jgi:hypothetical protein